MTVGSDHSTGYGGRRSYPDAEIAPEHAQRNPSPVPGRGYFGLTNGSAEHPTKDASRFKLDIFR